MGALRFLPGVGFSDLAIYRHFKPYFIPVRQIKVTRLHGLITISKPKRKKRKLSI